MQVSVSSWPRASNASVLHRVLFIATIEPLRCVVRNSIKAHTQLDESAGVRDLRGREREGEIEMERERGREREREREREGEREGE